MPALSANAPRLADDTPPLIRLDRETAFAVLPEDEFARYFRHGEAFAWMPVRPAPCCGLRGKA